MNNYKESERERAAAWKAVTTTLDEDERVAARYVNGQHEEVGPPLPFCIPRSAARKNLLPYAREMAIDLFAELEIPWHAGIATGPSNHLLDSQVQCVNALAQMVVDPNRVVAAFSGALDIAEVLEIEPGRFLTFEYIGPTDFFDEGEGNPRVRGTRCTSVDAAFKFRTSSGATELALVEWKYTEAYPHYKEHSEAGRQRRWDRYGPSIVAAEDLFRPDVLSFDLMLPEPFYQLVRQQLLAHELERTRAEDADVVRIIHVLSPHNLDYQQSLTPGHREIGSSVADIWDELTASSDRYVSLDPAVFLDPAITDAEYLSRYGPVD